MPTIIIPVEIPTITIDNIDDFAKTLTGGEFSAIKELFKNYREDCLLTCLAKHAVEWEEKLGEATAEAFEDGFEKGTENGYDNGFKDGLNSEAKKD